MKHQRLLKNSAALSGAAALLFLTACAAGPDFVRPEAPAVNRYNYDGDPKGTVASERPGQRFEAGRSPSANWWRMFRSASLDSVVSRGLAGNPGLEAARWSLLRSQENIRAGAGVFYPQVSAQFGTTRQQSSPTGGGVALPTTIFNLSTLAAKVDYTLDIFGGQRRYVEGLKAQEDEQRAELLATYMMLTGNMVNTTIALAAYRDEIDETERLIAIERDQVDIAEKRYRSGIETYAAVLSLRTQLDALEATLPPLRQQAVQAEHLLATLAGRMPAEWQAPPVTLNGISLPESLPLSLPSELVRQRPDILSAEARLHQASAQIGVETAAMFPSFTLNSRYGQTSNVMSELFRSQNNVWGIGADVTAPLFTGGTLSARRRAAIDAYKQSLALYRQTVLAAFAQVADAIRALEHDAESVRIRARGVADAELALALIQQNYRSGLVDYLQVLNATMQYRQARIGYLQAQAQQLQDTTALFVALGGGWQADPVAREKAGL